jgi:hypothetical protein
VPLASALLKETSYLQNRLNAYFITETILSDWLRGRTLLRPVEMLDSWQGPRIWQQRREEGDSRSDIEGG